MRILSSLKKMQVLLRWIYLEWPWIWPWRLHLLIFLYEILMRHSIYFNLQVVSILSVPLNSLSVSCVILGIKAMAIHVWCIVNNRFVCFWIKVCDISIEYMIRLFANCECLWKCLCSYTYLYFYKCRIYMF